MVTRQRHEFPADFSIRYFQPGNTWRRAAIRPGHAAGIEKQNTTASFIARNVRMGVQENIYIIRRMIGWNVLQSEFQTASQKINDKRPLKIGIAISAHDDHARTNRAKLVKNRFRTNIAKMPDFIGIFGHFLHAIREPIVRVGENEDTQRAFRFVHIFKRKFECSRIKTKAPTLLKRYGCMQLADYRRGTQLNLADTADSADSKCFTDDSTRSLSRVGSSQPGNSPFGFARPALSELL